ASRRPDAAWPCPPTAAGAARPAPSRPAQPRVTPGPRLRSLDPEGGMAGHAIDGLLVGVGGALLLGGEVLGGGAEGVGLLLPLVGVALGRLVLAEVLVGGEDVLDLGLAGLAGQELLALRVLVLGRGLVELAYDGLDRLRVFLRLLLVGAADADEADGQ